MEVQAANKASNSYIGMWVGIPVLFALLALQNAQAAPRVSVGEFVYAGTGCSDADENSISGSGLSGTIHFRHFDAGKLAVSGLPRVSCNVAIPVTVPSGYQVALQASFKGRIKGDGKLVRSYGTSVNPLGTSLSSNLASVRGKRFSQSDVNGAWSSCGGGIMNLRLNSSIQSLGSASIISVEKMTLRVAVRSCH